MMATSILCFSHAMVALFIDYNCYIFRRSCGLNLHELRDTIVSLGGCVVVMIDELARWSSLAEIRARQNFSHAEKKTPAQKYL
jgi:hypothetical protein